MVRGGRVREIRLRGLKIINCFNKRSLIFAIQYKFKLKKIFIEIRGISGIQSLPGAF